MRTSRSTCLISRGFLYECNGWAQAIVNTKALNVCCCAPKHFVKVFLSENIFVRLKHICTPGAPHFFYTLSRQFIIIAYAVDPQSFKNYLRHSLIFMWNSAIHEEFNFCFYEIFTSSDKIFISEGGLSTRKWFFKVLRYSWYFLIS